MAALVWDLSRSAVRFAPRLALLYQPCNCACRGVAATAGTVVLARTMVRPRVAAVSTAAAAAASGALAAGKARRHGRRPMTPITQGRSARLRALESKGSEGDSEPQLDSISLALRAALQRFESEVARPDEEIDVTRAAALLALHADPALDPDLSVIRPLAKLGEDFVEWLKAKSDVGPGGPAEGTSQTRAEALCTFLAEQGFVGCPRTDDGYYNAENSRMDRVLVRRKGIPISLSLVYMEVGRAAGLSLRGMGFPGHFLLGFGWGPDAGLLDAFTNRTLTEVDAAALLGELYGRPVQLDPSWRTTPRLPNVVFLLRMMGNLQNVYERDGNFAQAARVAQYGRSLEAAAAAAAAVPGRSGEDD